MLKLEKDLKTFIICYLVLLQISQSLCQINLRVVNGSPTTVGVARFVVQLYVDKKFWCGGTLVASRYVVTAAHCVYKKPAASIMVKGGASTLSETGIQSKVDRVMVHRNYNPSTVHKDVAVLKLASPLQGPLVEPVPLCTRGWKHNDPVQIFGWGKKHESGKINSNRIETVNLRVVGRFRCNSRYGFLTNSMFCAASPGKASCYGDSGGPVMVNGQFCGIISWAIGCARPGYPDVYTNILMNDINKFIRDSMRL